MRLATMIEHIDEEGVSARGQRIPAATVIWSAGVRATPVGQWLGIKAARNGAVQVDPDLSVPELPEVFVLGDAALAPGPHGAPLPGLAAVAEQQGRYVGGLITARVEGRAHTGPFVYRNQGTMATIGRSAAVADFGPASRQLGVVLADLWPRRPADHGPGLGAQTARALGELGL